MDISCVLLLLLLGFAAAKPTLSNFDSSLFASDGSLAITKQKFDSLHQPKDVFVPKYERIIIPPVVLDFIRNATADVQNDKVLAEFAADHPDMTERLVAVNKAFTKQIESISKARKLFNQLKKRQNEEMRQKSVDEGQASLGWPIGVPDDVQN